MRSRSFASSLRATLSQSRSIEARTLSSVGGTVAAMRAVCGGGAGRGSWMSRPAIAGHIAGGTHHAFFDRGEGFCVFSDIAVAANVALRDHGVRRVLIVDLDVHQGNGNAALFADDPRVYTFSVHCESRRPRPAPLLPADPPSRTRLPGKANLFSGRERGDLDVELA